MSIKNLRYWVFTSGEQGIHGLDWGVKHASEYFTDRQKLDSDYRALLRDFGLPPSLERPVNGVGLVLMSWDESNFITGFIFPGTDHGSRPNTSSVIFAVPYEIASIKPVNEVIKTVWEKNNIPEIALKNSQNRPDTLRLEGDSVVNETAPCFSESLSWPGRNKGFIQVYGRLSKLSRFVSESEAQKSNSLSLWKKIAMAFVIFLVVSSYIFIRYCVMRPLMWNTLNKYFTVRQNINAPVISESPEIFSPDNHESESQLPEIIDTPAPEVNKVKDSNIEINELREDILKLCSNYKDFKVTGKKEFKVKLNKNFDRELWEKLHSKNKNRISLIQNVIVTFKLSEPVVDNADLNECVEAFLKYFMK